MDETLDFLPEEAGVHVKAYVSDYIKLPFESESFQSFTTNLCPVNFLETARILEKGGIAGFSLLEKSSSLISLAEKAFNRAGLPFPEIKMAPGSPEQIA